MGKKAIVVADDKVILREAMKVRGIKQTELADKLGIKQPSLSGNMNRTKIGLDVFTKILSAMDYEVVVMDKKSGENVWRVEI